MLRDNYPVLFEGIHTTYYAKKLLKNNKNRQLLLRAHNVEHDYYHQLATNEKKLCNKVFFKIEALKLKLYEKNIEKLTVLAISNNDLDYFNNKYGNALLIPPFHPYDIVKSPAGKGKYILFHADLSVTDNIKSIEYLTKNVFNYVNYPIVIAGKKPHLKIFQVTDNLKHIDIIPDPDEEKMESLIKNAQVNICYTFQCTGIKLKLISSLFIGRFCLANSKMVKNTGLERLCSVKDKPDEIIEELNYLLDQEFENSIITERKKILEKIFSNKGNAETLANLLINVNNI